MFQWAGTKLRAFVITSLVVWSTMVLLGSIMHVNADEVAGGKMEGLLTVQRIEVKVAHSVPPQVFVRVHGVVLNGCTDIGAVEQHKDGPIVTVTMPIHSRDRVCPMIARLIDQTVKLEGDFRPGSYTVNVNGVVEQFKI